jgi:hypothetical protein
VDRAKPFCIPKREIWEAYKRVKANRGAAGVDEQSIEEFEQDLSNNLFKLWNRMSSGIRAFDQGAVIKSKHGFWLAIPTPAAGTGARGKRMTPGLWEQMHGGRLRFIYRRGAPSLLVAENMRARTGKRGGFAKGSASALRTGRGMTSVVMFILVPQVSLRKRLDVNAAAERWASALPELIVRNWRDG